MRPFHLSTAMKMPAADEDAPCHRVSGIRIGERPSFYTFLFVYLYVWIVATPIKTGRTVYSRQVKGKAVSELRSDGRGRLAIMTARGR